MSRNVYRTKKRTYIFKTKPSAGHVKLYAWKSTDTGAVVYSSLPSPVSGGHVFVSGSELTAGLIESVIDGVMTVTGLSADFERYSAGDISE